LKAITLLLITASLVGCSTAQKISRPDGSTEYLVQCGAGTGWGICYSKANELCPAGYSDLSKEAGFNRKELRIRCQ